MFITASKTGDADQSRKIGPAGDMILVIANADLFSECLAEALAKKFADCEVVSKAFSKAQLDTEANEAKLVLFYHIPGPELNEALQIVRENHPSTSIGLVIEAIDMLEPYVNRLVEARVIDGVLPLNLHLNVFMAAVDLLMKGGEHFPSALLNRLTNQAAQPEKSLYETKSVAAAGAGTLKLRQGDLSALTTREVQILDLICKGTQNKIIADELHLSENTVKVHVRNIYKKMNVRNRTEAASRFFNNEASGSGRWRN